MSILADLNSLVFGKAEGAAELAEEILAILADKTINPKDQTKEIRKLCNKAKKDFHTEINWTPTKRI